jgi:hypothetical protein
MAVVGFVLGIAIVVGLIALYLLPYIIGAKRGIASTTALLGQSPVRLDHNCLVCVHSLGCLWRHEGR